MFQTKTLYLKSLSGLDIFSLTEVINLLESEFDEKRGFGFIHTEGFSSGVGSTLIFKSITSQQAFDAVSGSFYKVEQPIYYQMPFEIDYSVKLFISYVGGERLRKLLAVLSKIFKFKVAIDDILVNLNQSIEQLDEEGILYQIRAI